MTHQDDLHLADIPQDQPTMELLDGAEAEAPRACCSLGHRIVRGGLYGLLVLSGTALLAISAVPELTNYVPEFKSFASFIPGSGQQGSCTLSSGHCTALDAAALGSAGGSPCCPSEAAVAFGEGGCSRGCDHSDTLASVSADAPSCCKDETSCPLTASKESADTPDEQPLDEEALTQLPVGEDLAPLTETEPSDAEAPDADESGSVETEISAETAEEAAKE